MGHDARLPRAMLGPGAKSFPVGPTHVRYRVLAAGCSLAVLTYIQRLGFSAGLPEIKKALALNDTEVGFLTAAFLVGYGLCQVPGGFLGDRFGGRHVLTGLVLVWSLLTAAVAATPALTVVAWLPFAFLVVVRFFFGATQAGGFPVLARVLADWMPARQRGLAQGLVWTSSRLGGAAAPPLFLALSLLLGDWAAPFSTLSGLGLLWCLAFWPWFRDRPGEVPAVNEAERALLASGRPTGAGPAPPVPWRLFLSSRSVWGLCLMYGFVGFSGNFITTLLQVYLRDHRHLDRATTAWLSGLPLVFGVVSCVLGGVASDGIARWTGSRTRGRLLVGGVSLVLAGLSVLAVIWVRDVAVLALLFSAMFFFNDANMAPAWAACADVGERCAGTLSGAMNMTGSFLGAAGMAFAGRLFDRGREDVVFVAFACSYGLAALCWLAVDATRPLVRSDEPPTAEAEPG
jgi:ACS family glucarate transporter-like MFS transporter